jgi:hypothetical protein
MAVLERQIAFSCNPNKYATSNVVDFNRGEGYTHWVHRVRLVEMGNLISITNTAGNHRLQRRTRMSVFEVVNHPRVPAEPKRYLANHYTETFHMSNRYFTNISVFLTLGVVVAISLGADLKTVAPDPMLPPFAFHRSGATVPEDAAKALFHGCARTSIKDFVQHLHLATCDGPNGTIQKFAECLHTTKFSTGDESHSIYDLLIAKDGGFKSDTTRIVASSEFPTDKKTAAVISTGIDTYYGENFRAVVVAADGFEGREYRTRIVVAVTKEGWFAIPRCRSSKAFYDIADAMPEIASTAETAK